MRIAELSQLGRRRAQICARLGSELRLIPVEDVFYFSAGQKYVTVRHRGGSDLIDESLRALAAEFAPEFVRIHRNSLVAVRHVSAVERNADGHYLVRFKDCAETLPVSRRHAAQTLRQLRGEQLSGRRQDDIGESTVTLKEDSGAAERRFYVRLGGVLLLAGLGYLVWRIVTPLWQPLLWATLLGSLLAPANSRLAATAGRPRAARQRDHDDPDGGAVHAARRADRRCGRGAGGATAAQAQWSGAAGGRRVDTGPDAGALAGAAAGLARRSTQASRSSRSRTGSLQRASTCCSSWRPPGGTFVLGALGTLVSFLLMLFVLFFVLRDGPALAQKVVRMLPIEERMRGKLWQHLTDVTRAVFMGIGLTALVQGMLVGIGFWIAGLPSALVFGVLAALFALVPLVGTVIVWGPGALYLASQGDYGHAIFLDAVGHDRRGHGG